MDYYRFDIICPAEIAEILVAYLSEAPFDTFEENETGMAAYLPARADMPETEALLETLKKQFKFTWSKTFIPGQNWNEIWESNFHPVVVGDFCAVRADFHEPIPGVQWELIINPKMAFGTGHHETTWQCMAAMEHLPLKGANLSSDLSILATQYSGINWSNARKATMDLCVAVFGREVLSTHSLTGLPSNVMLVRGQRVKPPLDVKKVKALSGLYNIFKYSSF